MMTFALTFQHSQMYVRARSAWLTTHLDSHSSQWLEQRAHCNLPILLIYNKQGIPVSDICKESIVVAKTPCQCWKLTQWLETTTISLCLWIRVSLSAYLSLLLYHYHEQHIKSGRKRQRECVYLIFYWLLSIWNIKAKRVSNFVECTLLSGFAQTSS